MQNRIFGSYLAAIDRILISVVQQTGRSLDGAERVVDIGLMQRNDEALEALVGLHDRNLHLLVHKLILHVLHAVVLVLRCLQQKGNLGKARTGKRLQGIFWRCSYYPHLQYQNPKP
jgi:hypothetical protein